MDIDDLRPDTIEDLTKQHPPDSTVPSKILQEAQDTTGLSNDAVAMTDVMETGLAVDQPNGNLPINLMELSWCWVSRHYPKSDPSYP